MIKWIRILAQILGSSLRSQRELALENLVVRQQVRYPQTRLLTVLEKDTPNDRPVQPLESGCIVEFPCVGGLHHEHTRMAA